jgi:hypothetical protein
MVSLSITPEELIELLVGEIDGDLIHHDYHEIQENMGFGNIVFEKCYTRTRHLEVIIIHTENIKGVTNATMITSTSLDDQAIELDWEVEDDCMNELMEILDRYIIDEKEME